MFKLVQSAEDDSDYNSDFEIDGDEMDDIMEKILMTFTKYVAGFLSKNKSLECLKFYK